MLTFWRRQRLGHSGLRQQGRRPRYANVDLGIAVLSRRRVSIRMISYGRAKTSLINSSGFRTDQENLGIGYVIGFQLRIGI
ncbi:MAG: hypothetical protein F6K55_24410 [Moorea sp. SIO4A3]|nr:hypothetical protein [Moorena sp. SIO4A3]